MTLPSRSCRSNSSESWLMPAMTGFTVIGAKACFCSVWLTPSVAVNVEV